MRPDGPARLGQGTARVNAEIRRQVRTLAHDRANAPGIEALAG